MGWKEYIIFLQSQGPPPPTNILITKFNGVHKFLSRDFSPPQSQMLGESSSPVLLPPQVPRSSSQAPSIPTFPYRISSANALALSQCLTTTTSSPPLNLLTCPWPPTQASLDILPLFCLALRYCGPSKIYVRTRPTTCRIALPPIV
jgi:hypothetical protein